MDINKLRTCLTSLAFVALLAAGPHARAETLSFKADLRGASEQPPVNTPASGTLTATYDTASKKFSWSLNFSGLTGNPTGAHFHGPDPTNKTNPAPEVVGILLSPLDGYSNLTDSQAADLRAGRWYFEIETAANPKGEIRGAVQQAK